MYFCYCLASVLYPETMGRSYFLYAWETKFFYFFFLLKNFSITKLFILPLLLKMFFFCFKFFYHQIFYTIFQYRNFFRPKNFSIRNKRTTHMRARAVPKVSTVETPNKAHFIL